MAHVTPEIAWTDATAAAEPRPAARPAVMCRGVTKVFGDGDARVHALRGVDLDVSPGEITLVVGPSGCGKTTLISTIAGLLSPNSGEIVVFGEHLHRLSGRQLVEFRGRHIGFVFQQYHLLPTLTAEENVAVPLLVAGWRRGAAIRRGRELLDSLGLANRAAAFPSQLSMGQQQRVAIARALVHDPRLLVCDEPTAALDAVAGQGMMELLRRAAVQPDRAVIIVTHDTRVFAYGERIVHMNDGRVERVDSVAATAGIRAPAEASP